MIIYISVICVILSRLDVIGLVVILVFILNC